MNAPMMKSEDVKLSVKGDTGFISPATIQVTIASGATFQNQAFVNPTSSPVTLVLPTGISRDGCVFGIGPGDTREIPISADAPRHIEIPYGVFFADHAVRDWGRAASPPTMKIGP